MAQIRGLLREHSFDNGEVWRSFYCPGCEIRHTVDQTWTFDGNYEAPTFSPSVLVTYRHPAGHTDDNPAPVGYNGPFVEDRCHSFVRSGRIEFLGDCTHSLAGQTVDIPSWPF